MKVFGESKQVARKEHWCDRCCNFIHPGQLYERQIHLYGKKALVFKFHIKPDCDWPSDPEDFDEITTEQDLSIAA